ncbi:MAG: AAA family ATPase, partial [Desulfuromonadales bacterium]|nr:AAA family ATPase [Desulfuromonadales bacterium]
MDQLQQRFGQLKDDLSGQVIGQPQLIEYLLIALLADGHLLVEGAPGLAKTRAIRQLGARLEGSFHRIQF